MKKVFFIFLLILGLVGCSDKEEKGAKGEKTKKEQILRVALNGKPKGVDPHMYSEVIGGIMSQQIFNSLVEIDENGNIIPELAESWEFKDPTTLVFNLKKGVKFHNGDELKASDVVFSINRMKNKPASMVMVEPISGAEALDDYTVKISLSKPFSSILYNLAHPRTSILNERSVKEQKDDLSIAGIGTGPFKLIEWGTGEQIILESFKDHFQGAPKYDKLVVKTITENTARAMALEAKDVDIAYTVVPIDLENLKNNPDLVIVSKPVVLTESITFNFDKEKFHNKALREAIAMAIDKKGIIEAIYNGLAIEANSPVSNVAFGYSDKVTGLPRDIEKAKQIVEENGLTGTKLKIITNDNPSRVQVAQIIQSNLKEIGLELEIEVVAWATYLQDLANANFEMKLGGWSGGTGDSDNILFPLYHSSSAGAAGNHGRYKNPELDKYIEAGRATSDPVERKRNYEIAQQMIQDNIACVPLYYSMDNMVMRKNIKNFKFRSTYFHVIKDIEF